jgi:hypothetical protein
MPNRRVGDGATSRISKVSGDTPARAAPDGPSEGGLNSTYPSRQHRSLAVSPLEAEGRGLE